VIALQKPERPATGRVPAGTLFLTEDTLMQKSKPFLSYTQQMDKLEHDKNLVIADRNYAETVLKRLSYFALISGYKKLYMNLTTRKYKDDTTFEEIVALYRLDENLRGLSLKYLLQIEQAMRSMLSYYFTEKHGDIQTAYLSPQNYDNSPRKKQALSTLLGVLKTLALNSTDYPYINHHRNKHKNVPLWVLAKVLTFGNISKLYQFFTQDIKVKVSKNYVSVNEKELVQYLKVLTKFRNVCAHNDRLFSFTTKDDIPDTVIHAKLGIAKKGSQYVYGKNDLFSLVIAFRYLLEKEEFILFKRMLNKEIVNFISKTTHISYNELLHEMGFPINWTKISAYKI